MSQILTFANTRNSGINVDYEIRVCIQRWNGLFYQCWCILFNSSISNYWWKIQIMIAEFRRIIKRRREAMQKFMEDLQVDFKVDTFTKQSTQWVILYRKIDSFTVLRRSRNLLISSTPSPLITIPSRYGLEFVCHLKFNEFNSSMTTFNLKPTNT